MIVWQRFQKFFFYFILVGVTITVTYICIHSQQISRILAAPVFDSIEFNRYILYTHIFTALPPLVIGLVEFYKTIRQKYPKLHRNLGKVYCICIWISSVLGILLASANTRGPVAQIGFSTLGVLWFTTTTIAYIHARKFDFFIHRRWMIRSYALTLAVVSVRPMFWFPPSFIDFELWYLIITWICWVPNLIIAEIYLRLTDVNGRLIKNLSH